MWPHTVAILIGGKSKRMGSPKHLVELPNGKTMLDMMLEFSCSVGTHTVIIGGDITGQHCIHDLRKQQGPVAGIEALLNSDIDKNYLVVGCDMPNLKKIDVEPLLASNDNAVFSCGNRLLGLPLLIKSEELSSCTAYLDSGGRSIRGFVSEIPHIEVKLEDSKSSRLLSINSTDDLNKLSLE
jgi:molybdopterin-guanine dinucleotide biosynthesis protein A